MRLIAQHFPRLVRCPRCGGSKGKYSGAHRSKPLRTRICRNPACLHRWPVPVGNLEYDTGGLTSIFLLPDVASA